MITGFDHVQLAMPRGREAAARSFYAGLLGMTERVQLLGGTLRAGPAPEGGWTVDAELPTEVRR